MAEPCDLASLQQTFVLAKFKEAMNQSKKFLLDIIEKQGMTNTGTKSMMEEESKCNYQVDILLTEEQNTNVSSLIAIYLQCIFELERHSEIDSAFTILRALAPIGIDCGILWAKLLLVTDKVDDAGNILFCLQKKLQSRPSKTEYDTLILELVVFDILLPSGKIAEALREIRQNEGISEEARANYEETIEGHRMPCPCDEEDSISSTTLPPSNSANSYFHQEEVNKNMMTQDQFMVKQSERSEKKPLTQNNQRSSDSSTDVSDSSLLLMISGGIAVSVALTVIGLRNRQLLKDTLIQSLDSFSHSLEDVNKYLFG